jgi:hypothetical protein
MHVRLQHLKLRCAAAAAAGAAAIMHLQLHSVLVSSING